MTKQYKVFAYWRKKDIDFLKKLKINQEIKEGYCSFVIEDDKDYKSLVKHYSRQNSFLDKVRPKEFRITFIGCVFSKEELDNAKYYMLTGTKFAPKDFPLPKDGYKEQVFDYDICEDVMIDNIIKSSVRINKVQKAPFRIKKPKWSKNQVSFNLHWEWDFMFFKKDFFEEILTPLGLKYRNVIQHNNGNPLEDTVQLDIPIAKSKILIENSAYDIYKPRCGKRQYARQYLDFFPPFEKEFDFYICYTQEEFDGGHKRIIISKKFCDLLLEYNLIKYESSYLIPMKRK